MIRDRTLSLAFPLRRSLDMPRSANDSRHADTNSNDQTPIRTSFVRSHNRFDLTRPASEVLLIRYHWGIRLVAFILCVLGLPVLACGLLGLFGQFIQPNMTDMVGVGLLLLWGGVVGGMGLWLTGPRFRFDTETGQLKVRFVWRTWRRPLADIVAVQVIDAGRFQSGSAETGGGPRYVFSSYQMNLMMKSDREKRVFVAYNSDLTDMARKAKILADFLHVPLMANRQVQDIVRSYREHDTPWLTQKPSGERFGERSLRRVRDRRLPEPYRSWIDRSQTLPTQVQILPRAVHPVYDLLMFLIVGGLFMIMPVLSITMFWDSMMRGFANGEYGIIVFVGGFSLLVAWVPLLLLKRLWVSLGAYRDLQRNRLRQGIMVGPAGVLVRMEPNRCYPFALDGFVNAKIQDDSDSENSARLFVVETLDGTTDFFFERITGPPDQLNRMVAQARSMGRGKK